MATETLTLTLLPDGSYHVQETEPTGEPGSMDKPINQRVKTAQEALSLVRHFLQIEGDEEDAVDGGADEASEGDVPAAAPAPNPKAAWNREAATRDPASGLRN